MSTCAITSNKQKKFQTKPNNKLVKYVDNFFHQQVLLPGSDDDPKVAQLPSRVATICAISKNFHEKPYSRPDLANTRHCQRHTNCLLSKKLAGSSRR